MQYVMMAILLGLLVFYFIYFYSRNKKETEKFNELMNSIKKGDNVLTATGVVGKVISIDENDGLKTITIETGKKEYKSYLTMDIQAVSAVLNGEKPNKVEKAEKVENVDNKSEKDTENKEQKKSDEILSKSDEVSVELNDDNKNTIETVETKEKNSVKNTETKKNKKSKK